MAVIFELVVNFGRDEEALTAATGELERQSSIEVRGVQVPVTPPSVTRFRSGDELVYIEFSVHPHGIGYARPDPHLPFETRDLGSEELSAAGEHLYGLLRTFHGYEAAIVGWDPESAVDFEQLQSEWLPDGSISGLHGLVLSDKLVEGWQPKGFVPFAAGYSWLPYRGTPNPLGAGPAGPPLNLDA